MSQKCASGDLRRLSWAGLMKNLNFSFELEESEMRMMNCCFEDDLNSSTSSTTSSSASAMAAASNAAPKNKDKKVTFEFINLVGSAIARCLSTTLHIPWIEYGGSLPTYCYITLWSVWWPRHLSILINLWSLSLSYGSLLWLEFKLCLKRFHWRIFSARHLSDSNLIVFSFFPSVDDAMLCLKPLWNRKDY